MNNVLISYILKNFLKTFFKVILIIYCFGIILNLFEEIEFFKNSDVGILLPIILTGIFVPSMIINLLPFIIFISSMWFMIKIRNNKDLLILKIHGYSNIRIFFILAFTSFLIGWLVLFVANPATSSMVKYYESTKAKYARDIDHLVTFNKNGLWIKENLKNGDRIIAAKKADESILKDVTIFQFDQNYSIKNKILAEEAFIQNNNWILKDVYNNLISYGYRINEGKNEYHDLTLEELIHKYRYLGSFDLRDKIHNYIRLALLENRKIDIQNIYPYWVKYYQRKDYTLYSLPIALKTLQTEDLIGLKECVELIHEIQEVSEKGYRHLLAEFIELYPAAKIISFLESNFDTKELRVEWFKLPKKYINNLNERTYNIEENKLLNYHRNSSIPFEEIENVLFSNKFEKLRLTLNLFKLKISYKENQRKTVLKFKQSKLMFEEQIEQKDYDQYEQNSQQRFDNGTLTFKDLNFIKKKKLKSYEIAKYSDGYYASLPEIDVFKIYNPKEIKEKARIYLQFP